jgi:hypothetical protein
MRKKLTPKLIDSLPPPNGRRYEVRDELVVGLLIRVSANKVTDGFDYLLFSDNLADVGEKEPAHNVASTGWLSCSFCHRPFRARNCAADLLGLIRGESRTVP